MLGDQTRQTFGEGHAKRANTLRTKPDGCGHHQVGAIGLQQVDGANVSLEARGDQRHDVHQRFSRLAAIGRQMADLFQRQDVTGSTSADRLSHRGKLPS